MAATVLIGIVAYLLVWRKGHFSKWVAVLTLPLLVIVMGQTMGEAANMWTGNSYPAVPLILTALAVWGTLKGASAAARVGCVLFWIVLIAYPVIFGAALPDVMWREAIQPTGHWTASLLPLFLLPSVASVLRKGKDLSARIVIPGVYAVIGSALTMGMLYATSKADIYEMVRSIDLMGAMKHFEALASATATVGWYGLLSLFLAMCGAMGEWITGCGKTFVVVGALSSMLWMLCNLRIGIELLAVLTAVSWVLNPILVQGMEWAKKIKKCKNSP